MHENMNKKNRERVVFFEDSVDDYNGSRVRIALNSLAEIDGIREALDRNQGNQAGEMKM